MQHRHTVRCQIVGLLGQGGGGGIFLDARESTERITDATRYVQLVAFSLIFVRYRVPSIINTILLFVSYCTLYSALPSLVRPFVCMLQSIIYSVSTRSRVNRHHSSQKYYGKILGMMDMAKEKF